MVFPFIVTSIPYLVCFIIKIAKCLGTRETALICCVNGDPGHGDHIDHLEIQRVINRTDDGTKEAKSPLEQVMAG